MRPDEPQGRSERVRNISSPTGVLSPNRPDHSELKNKINVLCIQFCFWKGECRIIVFKFHALISCKKGGRAPRIQNFCIS